MVKVYNLEDPDCVSKAASVLRDGGVIIYPTETLFGIGTLALVEEYVRKVFEVKGRDYNKPLPVLFKNLDQLSHYIRLDSFGRKLAEKFLPGPLTLISEQKIYMPSLISAGTGKIACRISSNNFVAELLDILDEPITSTSANISNSPNLFRSDDIIKLFSNKVDLIVDSGSLPDSKGSTIIDITTSPPLVVREGDIGKEELLEFI